MPDGANIPSLVYGVRQNGLWCPVRAMSMPCGFMYPSQFRWMLIMSETHQAARRGAAPPVSLFKRKTAAYQQLNAALADPVNKYSFETILSVNAALFVEARIVGPQITKMHLKALDQRTSPEISNSQKTKTPSPRFSDSVFTQHICYASVKPPAMLS